ncbi:MAG: DUF1501 domain-containing protein [Acidimicrobiia bacterium]
MSTHDVSRRRFLTGLGVSASAAVVAGYGLTVWDRTPSPGPSLQVATKLGGHDDRTLVVVELGGGNDGLNTVVPTADPAYHSLRPSLGVTDAIALDDQVGLHPELAKLAARYHDGHVAIIEGVGYPDPNLSHFASLAYWWSGVPGESGNVGWLGRYLDGTVGFDDPLAAVSIGPMPSPALLGTKSFATSITDASGLQPALPAWADGADDLVRAWSGFAPASPDAGSLLGEVQQAITHTVAARRGLDRELSGVAAGADAFALAAQLVVSDRAPRIVYLNGLGDFDTHQGEAQRHPALMRDLDAGLDTFLTTIEAAGRADKVLVMTVSEFGRRPAENGSGTDHGTAAPHFLIGAGVKGGRYGTPPSLTALDPHGNLVAGTDFRALYATVLADWLGVEPAAVLGKGHSPLPVLA